MSWLDTYEKIRTRDFRKAKPEERERVARDVINSASYACAVVAVAPIPFSDAVLMFPIQSAMVIAVGHVYGRRVDASAAKDLLVEIGAVAGAGFLARQGIKALLPVFGAIFTIPAAFAANWAIGRVAMEYFQYPGASRDHLNEVYRRAKEEGGAAFSEEAFENFRGRHEDEVKGVAGEPSETRAKGRRNPQSVRSIVEEELPRRIARHRDLAERIDAVIHLDISGEDGGRWTVDFTRPSGWVQTGLKGVPEMTVTCADRDFVEIATGAADATSAVFAGTLRMEPMNLDLAKGIAELFA
jgi:uncharacterized protein (DUF697 family)